MTKRSRAPSNVFPVSPRVEVCEQDLIEQAAPLGREFFTRVLDMDWDECLLTDESALSDFALCGMPAEELPEGKSLAELYALWDTWVLAKIQQEFGVAPARAGIRLVSLLGLIEAHRRQVMH